MSAAHEEEEEVNEKMMRAAQRGRVKGERRGRERKRAGKKRRQKKIQSVNLRAHAHPSKPRARLTATAANGCVADATC